MTQILFLLTVPACFAMWILPFTSGLQQGLTKSLLLLLALLVGWLMRDAMQPWWDGNRFSRWADAAARWLADKIFGGEYDKEYEKG